MTAFVRIGTFRSESTALFETPSISCQMAMNRSENGISRRMSYQEVIR